MEKKGISLVILAACILCLIVGLFTPKNNVKPTKLNEENQFVKNLENVGDRIALLNIEGPISSDLSTNAWQGEYNTDSFLTSIEKVQKDKKAKAVVIRINSPGGTVAASQDIYDAVLRLRAEKPVVVSMADVAASGGYYIASAADRIVAQKGTMTGSIGVIFNFVDVANLANKVGVSSNTIKSGKFKDSGSMYRKMTPDEQALFQSSINNAYKQFVDAITVARINRNDSYNAERKDLTEETLKTFADGRVFLGEEAYKLGFVDKLGSQYDAVLIASQMAGSINALPVVSYNKMSGLKSLLLGMESKISTPLKEVLPFSYLHNSQPLMIWE